MYEVLWAHIDIVVVAVKSLSSSVGASPSYQPYEGGISPTLSPSMRSIHASEGLILFWLIPYP